MKYKQTQSTSLIAKGDTRKREKGNDYGEGRRQKTEETRYNKAQDTRHKAQGTRHKDKTRGTRHKVQDTKHEA